MGEQHFQALGVMLRRVDAAAMRHADHDGTGESSASAIAHARHVARNLVQRGIQKPHELNLGDRTQPLRRHADRHAGDHALGQRGVLNTILAELLLQTGCGAEYASIDANVLADDHDGWIARHLPRLRAVDGLDHRYLSHGAGIAVRTRVAHARSSATSRTSCRTWHRCAAAAR